MTRRFRSAAALVLGLAITAAAFAGWHARADEDAGFAARQAGEMRADLARIHQGHVDAGTLARMTAAAATPDFSIGQDQARHIAQYLAQPAPPERVAQLLPGPRPAAPTDDRTYVGQKMCTGCHRQETANWAHTIHASVFTLNPRSAAEGRGCEACHGPGSAHVSKPSDMSLIISFSHKSLTPVPQQNAQCMGCHQGGQRIFWHGSIHETENLSCSDCHNPMASFSTRGLAARDSINQTCFSCHKVQRAEFNKRSHMPLLEGKLDCTDCHNPHGSTTAPLLKADSVNEVCYGCHAEKRGPFLFEHAPVRENCINCHTPHGSNFESLLNTPRPLLCQQCHVQDDHPAQLMTRGNLAGGPRPDPRLIATSCQTCHVNVHGSNSPAGSRFER